MRTLIPLTDREVGLQLVDLASDLGIPSNQIVLTKDGYSVPDQLAEAYGGAAPSISLASAPVVAPLAVSSSSGPVCFTKPGKVDLCVYRGDSGRVRVRVTDADAQPVNVSTATWDCDIRATADDPTVLCSPTVTPVVGTPNAVDVVISAVQSALLNTDCVWDLQMTLAGAVTTILAGKVLVTKDVSRA